jgi:hypothetical protein
MPPSTTLPPLYAAWIDALLGGEIPDETNATCLDCAMLVSEAAKAGGDGGFNPHTKCCTYLPELWNFLVGGVLLDDSPEAASGRRTVEARLDAGVAVTALGLRRSTAYQLLYRAGGAATFGKSQAMRCPHYLHEHGGLCGVWRHRESTCATWFCKHTRGAVGEDFWEKLHGLLTCAEQSVAAWCLIELGIAPDHLGRLFLSPRQARGKTLRASDVDGVADEMDLQASWGPWRGRERELFRECARLAQPLDWPAVLRLGGARLDVHARIVRDAYRRLVDTSAPSHPTSALIQITPRGDRVRLATYSGSDELDVPAEVAAALRYFDGRPRAAALEAIRRSERLEIDDSLVRKLADFGVLREA